MRVIRFLLLVLLLNSLFSCSDENTNNEPRSVVWVDFSLKARIYDADTGSEYSILEDIKRFKVEKDTGYAWVDHVDYNMSRIDCLGNVLASCEEMDYFSDWDIDERNNVVWGAGGGRLIKWNRETGEMILIVDDCNAVHIAAVDSDGSCWAADWDRVYRVSSDGDIEFAKENFNKITLIDACDEDGSCLIYDENEKTIYRYSSGGDLLYELVLEMPTYDIYVRDDGCFYITRDCWGVELYSNEGNKIDEITFDPYIEIGKIDMNETAGVLWACPSWGTELVKVKEDLSEEIMRVKLPGIPGWYFGVDGRGE